VRLRKESEYGLEAVLYLAQRPKGAASPLAVIARDRGLPAGYLAKTLHKLVQHGILKSSRGKGSGYALLPNPDELPVKAVLEAIEGPMALESCLLWDRPCSDRNPCRLHGRGAGLRIAVCEVLESTTIGDLVETENEHNEHGKREV